MPRELEPPVAEAGVPDETLSAVAVPLALNDEVEPLAVPLNVLLPLPLSVIVRVVLSVPVEHVPVKAPA